MRNCAGRGATRLPRAKILIPDHVEDGMNLIWNSDLVISGGGTMNREAAAMRVPVYSIFRGKIGAVDRYLADEGRLVLLESVEDVRTKIVAVRRENSASVDRDYVPALETIVQHIETILAACCEGADAEPVTLTAVSQKFRLQRKLEQRKLQRRCKILHPS